MFRIINNNFKIIIVYKDFLNKSNSYLDCVPRKDMYYKDYIRNVSLDLLELIVIVNNVENKNRLIELKENIKSKIALLDFLIDRLFIKRYINENALCNIMDRMVKINKMSTVWINRMIKNECKN